MGGEKKEEKIFTVSQITGLIKTMLEGSFKSIYLEGEISNFRPNSSGHLYFKLKDSSSQIKAVMFRFKAGTLDFIPKDGMFVKVQGAISVYEPNGEYQIIINSMKKAGMGDIMEMIEERKRRLSQEGLFDARRKRPLPLYPHTVGVVTSATGAALKDIIRVSHERNPKVNIIVLPAQVQGAEAAGTIVRMIDAANIWNLCDILIVGRGGGSLEDLLPFSEENVVRAIASSKIPIISAVGHEIDWALSDFAADKRAATPSNAAELAVPELNKLKDNLDSYSELLVSTINHKIQNLKLMLKTFSPENMEMRFRQIEQPLLMHFDDAKEKLGKHISERIDDTKAVIKECVNTLENCNPQTILNRGYSMVTDENGKVIREAKELKEGQTLIIKPQEGIITAKVEKIQEAIQ